MKSRQNALFVFPKPLLSKTIVAVSYFGRITIRADASPVVEGGLVNQKKHQNTPLRARGNF